MAQKTKSFSLNENIYNDFMGICDNKLLNRSLIIEKFLSAFISNPEEMIKIINNNDIIKDDTRKNSC